ncbi:MAG: RteC domain-containing protein [Lutibacter sp.]
MKKIDTIISDYSTKLSKIEKSNIIESNKIHESVKLSILCLEELRLLLKKNDFTSIESEINFFKYQKPYVYGRAIYFSQLQKFQTDKPKSNIREQRNFIEAAIRKLEIKKYKQREFFRYCRNREKRLDKIYFLRSNEQLEIYLDPARLDDDPQFSTSHCKKAAEIIEYDLLTSFYDLELNNLLKLENNLTIKEVKPAVLNNLSWTGTKTELVEMIYGLIASGSLRNGKAEIKKVVKICELIFEIDLGNFYKTYGEIKARDQDPTKFIDKLKLSLIQKINLDNNRLNRS